MDRSRFHEGIGRMPFTDIFGRSERSELSQMEAAELLGINDRGFAVTPSRPERTLSLDHATPRRQAL